MNFTDFGKRMQNVREQLLEMNQTELAEQLGSVQGLVSRMERGIGGNINMVFDFISLLEKKGYASHFLFKKDFDIELLKQKTPSKQSANKTAATINKKISELKKIMQVGYENAVAVESLLLNEQDKKIAQG